MYRNRKYRSNAPNVQITNSQQNRSQSLAGSSSSSTAGAVVERVLSTLSSIPASRQNFDCSNADAVPAKQQKLNPIQEDELFSVPASQVPSQLHYVSQRSVLLGRTQSTSQLTGAHRIGNNYFETVLIKCNVNLDFIECYVLTIDHSTFISKLLQHLRLGNEEDNAKKFLKGLSSALNKNETLAKLLTGCRLNLPTSMVTKQSQESLINDFLFIDSLQKDLIDILFDRIKVFAMDENSSNLDVPYIELMLNQFKFVDQIKNGERICAKMFAILEVATNHSKQLIIGCLEDVVDLTKHNEVVKKLMEMFPSDEELLTKTAIGIFGNMCINKAMQWEIRRRIIRYFKNGAPIKLYATYLKFVLNIDADELENSRDSVTKLIIEIQQVLKWDPTLNTAQEIKASQIDAFECVAQSVKCSKRLFDIWLKCIQNVQSHNQKPIDLLFLLIMMQINDEKSNYIENIIRRKIKSEQFNKQVLEEMVHKFAPILVLYSNLFLELMDSFFRDKNVLISNFGRHAFQVVFVIESFNRVLLLSKLISFVCQKQPTHSGSKEQPGGVVADVTTNALLVLSELNKLYCVEMQVNGSQLLRILDRKKDLTLGQFRQFMNILSSLAYPLPPLEGRVDLQDHIDMLIRKQVGSSLTGIKNQGIIGAVRVIEHIIWQPVDQVVDYDSDEMYNTIEELPNSEARTAAKYIELILTSTINCPESLALCFDELASVISQKNTKPATVGLNTAFLTWLCDFILNDFQTYFIIEEPPKDDGGIELAYQQCINTRDEVSNEELDVELIAVNISGCVLRPAGCAISSIKVLSSIFNLIRVILYRQKEGSLVAVNAVLGCAIVLPKSFGTPADMDIFEDYDDFTARKILDIYFYTVNWMRELISGFISQGDAAIKRKILLRLSEIIKFEEKIRLLLKVAPGDYVPPNCQYQTPAHTSVVTFKKPLVAAKRNVSKKKTPHETHLETENMTIMHTGRTQLTGGGGGGAVGNDPKKAIFAFSYGSKEIYRQMDPDVMLLLGEDLIIDYPLPASALGHAMGLLEFKFLMEDLVLKLESIFGVKKFVADQQWQYIICPDDFVNDLVLFLPNIMNFFKQLTDRMKALIEATDGHKESGEFYTDESNYIKICIGLCLRLLAAFYSWPNFDDDLHADVLKKSMASILAIDSSVEVLETDRVEDLTSKTIDLFTDYHNFVLDLRSAVHMFHLIKSLSKFCADPLNNESLVKLCKHFLTRPWHALTGSEERGAQSNILLNELLKGYFQQMSSVELKKIVCLVSKEIQGINHNHDSLRSFPCIYKSNFPLIFRAICVAVIESVNLKLEHNEPINQQMKFWEKSCDLINALLDIIKIMDIPRNFSLFLRYSHIFIKKFLQHGMPMLESCLRRTPERVSELLKSLQHTTRFLHNLCCHSKATKNSGIVAQIPFLRETIEQFVFSVKAALAANNCSTVFWMGNLKNKDLHGAEILTQSSSTMTMNNEENEEFIPEDDDNLDDDEDPSVAGRQRISAGSRDTSSNLSTSVSQNTSHSQVL